MKLMLKMIAFIQKYWATKRVKLIIILVIGYGAIEKIVTLQDAFKIAHDLIYKEQIDSLNTASKEIEIENIKSQTKKLVIDSINNAMPIYPRDNVREIILEKAFLDNRNPLFAFSFGNGITSTFSVEKLINGICIAQQIGIFSQECAIKIYLNQNKNIVIDYKIYDRDKKLVGVIEGNNILLNHNRYFTYNMDEFAIEVIDNNYNVIFSLEYFPPNQLFYQGLIFKDDGQLIIASNDGFATFPSYEKSAKETHKKISKIFKYTGNDWINKRVRSN